MGYLHRWTGMYTEDETALMKFIEYHAKPEEVSLDLSNRNSETTFPGWKTRFQVTKAALISSLIS